VVQKYFCTTTQNIALGLLNAHYEFTFINNEALESVESSPGRYFAGKGRYKALIIPATVSMSFVGLRAVEDISQNGIPVIFLKCLPEICTDAAKQADYDLILRHVRNIPTVTYIEEYYLYKQYTYAFSVECLSSATSFSKAISPLIRLGNMDDRIKCTVRKYVSEHIYFLVNEEGSIKNNRYFFMEKEHPSIWNALTGERKACKYMILGDTIVIDLHFEPHESKLIAFSQFAPPPASKKYRNFQVIYLDEAWKQTVSDKEWIGPLFDEYFQFKTIILQLYQAFTAFYRCVSNSLLLTSKVYC
jgi:hypothetical protein